MADLQKLRKRLNSISATGQMAEAMKTVASVKYAKLLRTYNETKKFSLECEHVLELIADSSLFQVNPDSKNRNCYIIIGSDRGFCGGFNQELHKFIRSNGILDEDNALIIACGKKLVSFLSDQNVSFEERHISDIVTFEEIHIILKEAEALYESGEIKAVYLVCQQYINVISQKPKLRMILPLQHRDVSTKSVGQDILFLPGKDAFSFEYSFECLSAEVYEDVLGHCLANQAATLSAMRSACDNAKKTSDDLILKINRIRQSQVTNSVIETSSGIAMENLGY